MSRVYAEPFTPTTKIISKRPKRKENTMDTRKEILPEDASPYVEPILLMDANRGAYLPQEFARGINRDCLFNVDPLDLETLANGPDDNTEDYWEAWDVVLSDAEIYLDGRKYTLSLDSDLWAWPEGYYPIWE